MYRMKFLQMEDGRIGVSNGDLVVSMGEVFYVEAGSRHWLPAEAKSCYDYAAERTGVDLNDLWGYSCYDTEAEARAVVEDVLGCCRMAGRGHRIALLELENGIARMRKELRDLDGAGAGDGMQRAICGARLAMAQEELDSMRDRNVKTRLKSGGPITTLGRERGNRMVGAVRPESGRSGSGMNQVEDASVRRCCDAYVVELCDTVERLCRRLNSSYYVNTFDEHIYCSDSGAADGSGSRIDEELEEEILEAADRIARRGWSCDVFLKRRYSRKHQENDLRRAAEKIRRSGFGEEQGREEAAERRRRMENREQGGRGDSGADRGAEGREVE